MKIFLKMRKILIIFLIAIITICTPSVINATDITISSTTPGGLKNAMETVENGSAIYMKNGVYKGENNTKINLSKSLHIEGLGSNVVIDGEGKNQIFIIPNKKISISIKSLKIINGYGENYDAGAIYSIGTLTITSCTFKNNGGYGAIISDNTLTVNKCIFKNNKAEYGGTITSFGKLTVKSSTFTNNHGKSSGAIESIKGDGKTTISKCRFKNNKAVSSGAIFSNNPTTVKDCIFINNQARYVGGAILHSSNYYTFSVSKSIFTNNKANLGGAIYSDGDTLTMNKCTFTNNQAKKHGGAIYSSYSLIIKSCFLAKNQANGCGGAIFHQRADDNPYFSDIFTVSKSTFAKNIAGNKGGAIFNGDFEKLQAVNSKFSKNIAGNNYNEIFGKVFLKNVKITPQNGVKVKK